MKKKIALILCCSLFAMIVGTSIAYYNTKSFGFDENTTLIEYDEEKFTFMDFNIYYKDISNFLEKVGTVVPDQSRLI